MVHRLLSGVLAAVLALSSAGCTFFPTSGPSGLAIKSGTTVDGPEYALVKLSPDVTRKVAEFEPHNFVMAFGDRRPPPEIKFGVGDVVSVTIFEAQAGGLFIPAEAGVRPGNFVQLPNQIVDARGTLSVPYAGNIPVAGRTPTEVQRAIVAAISNRAIDPQAIVTLVDQRATQISVLGDVNTPNRFQANPAGELVLDAITRAGGNAFMEYSVPEAIIKLKQGFGRLIRTKSDVGAVVLLDRRVVTKRYGAMMLEGLPPATRAIGNWPEIRHELEEFFAMHGIGAPVSWS